MMDAAQKKVEEAVNTMLGDIDQASLRKIQLNAFKCCAGCCDNTGYSMDDRQRCIGKCMETVGSAQEVLSAELNNFQNRIERCVMDCSDKMRDKSGGDAKKVAEHTRLFEDCVAACADSHIKLLPNMSKTVMDKLKKY